MQPSPETLAAHSNEMKRAFTHLQRSTVRLSLPGLLLAALALTSFVRVGQRFEWAIATALGLLALIPLVWFVSRWSFGASALLVGLGLAGGVLSTVLWGEIAEGVVLLFLPLGFITLALGVGPGAVASAVVCLLLWLVPGPFAGVAPSLRAAAMLAITGGVGMQWLTLRPLLAAADWSWEAFHYSRELLEEARQSQARLRVVLEDLTNANQQLNHLNTLANNLRRAAEEERRTKEQFVANVSHELRTPLNMIIGFCEMILKNPEAYKRPIPPNLLADLQVVLRNSQHLSGLIDDVLDLSQIEARQMALVKEWVQVEEITEAVIIAVRPLYESKGLALECDVQSDLPGLYCDRTRIREVLLNLLSNAGRFTEQGRVRLRAWQEAGCVQFSVADSGPGISEEDQRRLFQPFQQLDPTLRRRHGGTGLGLAISKSFVELHDGKMWVESIPGQGTTFFFRLPLEPQAISKAGFARWVNPFATHVEKPTRVPALPAVDKRPRLLVVDPGSVLQRLLRRYLPDVEIDTAPSLSAAPDALERSPAQAVLVNLPTAREPSEVLDQAASLPYGTPVVVCSIAAAGQEGPAAGLPEVLVKPISYDALTGAVERLGCPVETILLVDDEPDAQKLFRRMLTSAGRGYQVLRAENGLQALELLGRTRVDAILLDLVMPEMDGFTFLKVKEQDPAIRDIPVILISAQDQRGHPIVSNFIAAARPDGISTNQLLDCIQALGGILGPRS